jgi:hypothetical protein
MSPGTAARKVISVVIASQSLAFFQIGGDDGGAGFDELLLRFGEGIGKVAFDIELAGEFFVRVNGNDDFGLNQGGTRKIARFFGYVLHDDDLTRGGGRAAETGVERNARFGSEAANKGSDDQKVLVCGIEEIKTDPIVAGHFFVKAFGDALHEGLRGGGGTSEILEFLQKLFLLWRHGVGLESQAGKADGVAPLIPFGQQFTRTRRSRNLRWPALSGKAACKTAQGTASELLPTSTEGEEQNH